jgi:hypothetical protein
MDVNEDRDEESRGLTVALPDGRVLRLAFSRNSNSENHLFPFSAGGIDLFSARFFVPGTIGDRDD